MSKDLDLDFSEITKAKKAEGPPPVSQTVTSPVKEDLKPLGVNIALDVKDQDGTPKVLLKDLAYLTGEEFLIWAARVFPVLDQKDANPRHFDSRSAKAAAFDQILRFHTNSIFHIKKEPSSKPH